MARWTNIIDPRCRRKKGRLEAMKDFDDEKLRGMQKQKGTDQPKDKKVSKLRKTPQEIEAELELFLQGENRKHFDPKPSDNFRNNQRKFQYDYEEDFYEPDYDEDGF
ncbi:MAG: hypothetical protein Q3993_06390 [Filifactor alocis]|nr:hypothetical protein [Filifactor alocis]